MKERPRELWKRILRPSCFGTRDSFTECINRYFKRSTAHQKVIPCPYYWDCLEKNIEELEKKKKMSEKEALAGLIKVLVGLKVYLVWYDDPWATEVGNDGEEFGVERKELLVVCASKRRAGAFIRKRCGLQQWGDEKYQSPYKTEDHRIEEMEVQ